MGLPECTSWLQPSKFFPKNFFIVFPKKTCPEKVSCIFPKKLPNFQKTEFSYIFLKKVFLIFWERYI